MTLLWSLWCCYLPCPCRLFVSVQHGIWLFLFSCSVVLCLMSSVAAATKSMDGPAKNGNATSDGHTCQRHNCSSQCQGIQASKETGLLLYLLNLDWGWSRLSGLSGPLLCSYSNTRISLYPSGCKAVPIWALTALVDIQEMALLVFIQYFWSLSSKDRGMSPLVLNIKHLSSILICWLWIKALPNLSFLLEETCLPSWVIQIVAESCANSTGSSWDSRYKKLLAGQVHASFVLFILHSIILDEY